MNKYIGFLTLALGLNISFQNSLMAQSWLWAYGGTGQANVEVYGISNQSVVVDGFGHVYTMAYTEVAPYYTIIGTDTIYQGAFIVKHDITTGNVNWVKHDMKGITTHSLSIVTDHSGNLYVACQFYDTAFIDSYVLPSKGGYDILVMKLDSLGNVVWAKSAGGTAADNAESIAIDSSGNIYVTGGTKSGTIFFEMDSIQNNSTDISYLTKYEGNSGNVIWAKGIMANPPITINTQVRSCSMTFDQNNNLFITGDYKKANAISCNGDTVNAPGNSGYFLAKLDTLGHIGWLKAHKNLTYTHVMPDRNGNLYLSGMFSTSDTFNSIPLAPYGIADVFIASYDTAGNEGWIVSGGIPATALIENGLLVDDSAKIYLMTGYYGPDTSLHFHFGSNVYDVYNPKDPVYFIKLDSLGHTVCSTSIRSGGDDYLAITMDKECNIYACGDYLDSCTFDATLLYNPTGDESYFLAKLVMPCPHVPEYVESVKTEGKTMLYPNPANARLTINSGNLVESIVIMDVMGQSVYTFGFNSSKVQMDISQLASGIYFIKINNSEVQKFVKE